MTIRYATLCCWTVWLTCRLAIGLSESAVLLTIRTAGPCMSVCVTLRCRCRLLERPVLFLARSVLRLLGCCVMLLLSRVLATVVRMLALGIFGLYRAMPLWTALVKMAMLRLINVT